MSNIDAALIVSVLAMAIIFINLSILIYVIKALVAWMPYKAPPPAPLKPAKPSAADAEMSEHIAIIHSALAHYLGKQTHEIQVTDIRPL